MAYHACNIISLYGDEKHVTKNIKFKNSKNNKN